MSYEQVISLLGEFGPYQRIIYFIICIPTILCAFQKMGNVFLVAEPNYRCRIPGEPEDADYHLNESMLSKYYPKKDTSYSSCEIIIDGKIQTCDSYIFDDTVYGHTTVIEFELTCKKAYLIATTNALFMVGVMLGSMGFGEMSDRLGRRPTFFISLTLLLLGGLGAAAAPELWTYNFARMIVGACTSGVFLVLYVISLEMVGPTKRFIVGTVCHMYFSVGYMLVSPMAYYIRHWRWLELAFTIPGVIFFVYWWIISESPRWLWTKGRMEEAKKLIQHVAKYNKVTVPDQTLNQLLVEAGGSSTKAVSIFHVFKYPRMRKRALIIFFDWIANNMSYYGLSWNNNNLEGDPYLNFIISGGIEIPGYTILLLFLNTWGRRKLICTCMIVSGIALLLTTAIPHDQEWLVVTLAMVGKMAITASYGGIYILSTEQFPTVIRNAGLGAGSTLARIGSIIAPYINALSYIWLPLPLIVFGGVSLLGGIMSLVLPETLNKNLPETLEEAESFGGKNKRKDVN